MITHQIFISAIFLAALVSCEVIKAGLFSRVDTAYLCENHQCGINAKCEVKRGVSSCKCLSGFAGNPDRICRSECKHDSHCANDQICSSSLVCQNPCELKTQCGANAKCEVIDQQVKCACPKGWVGNPMISCQPEQECTHLIDCPKERPTCLYYTCVNPCVGACGANAICELINRNLICSCPETTTGNPFIGCEPLD